jgi:RDD family
MTPDAVLVGSERPQPRRARASVRRRLAATIYELLLLTALAILVGFVTLPAVGPRPSSVAINAPVPLPSQTGRIVSFGALFIAWGLYCVGFWSSGRRTLPMKTWKLALETRAGEALGIRAATVRYLACWIGPACAVGAYLVLHAYGTGPWAVVLLGVNYAWALIDVDRQFLQDRMAGSRLVVCPPV